MAVIRKPINVFIISFLMLISALVFAQDTDTGVISADRGTIPEELMRPRLDESPRYAVDMVIGPLGKGDASTEAYSFACKVAEDLLAANADAASLKAMSRIFLEGYLSALEVIGPRSFRLGGGKTENDGSVSFLVRFIGRELAITGELYIRFENVPGDDETPAKSVWIFEDLILEDAQNRKEENDKAEQRFDFSPYHRFY